MLKIMGIPSKFICLIAPLLLFGCEGAERDRETAQPAVVLLGVDGLSWKVLGPLIEAGQAPALGAMASEGATCRQFQVVSPHSPLAWTSVATSRSPQDHGIVDYVTRLPDGSVVPASGNLRKAKAIWEVSSENNRSVGVAGWWASWPAEAVNGWVISDHANPVLRQFLVRDGKYWTANVGALATMSADYFPVHLAESVTAEQESASRTAPKSLEMRGLFSEAQLQILRATPWYQRSLYSGLKTFHAIDASTVAAVRYLLGTHPVDLLMTYLRGPDPIQHLGWDLIEPEKYVVANPFHDRDSGIVEAVYRYTDGFVADVLGEIHDQAWVIIASDHGSEPDPRAVGDPRLSRPGGHSEAAKGVLMISGPEVKRGFDLSSASPFDIMPTILWLMDLPISRELEGRVLTEAFEPSFVERKKVRLVDSYGPRQIQPIMASEVDEAMLENLRALGYLD